MKRIKMKRTLVVLVSILALLTGTIAPVLAQDDALMPLFIPFVGTDTNQQSSQAAPEATDTPLFIPFVGADAAEQRGEIGLPADGGVLQPESPEPITVDKAVTAAGRGINDLTPVSIIVVFDESVTAEQLAAVSGGQVIHRYDKIFRGASLVVSEQQIEAVAGVDGVQAVYLDTLQQLETDASPAFIGAPIVWNALGGQSSAGEGVVVGILDSGIWPEHPSFSDPDPLGKPYAPRVPALPLPCDFGNTVANANDAAFTCNNKLIGAYAYLETYKAVIGLMPSEFDSARDDNGHGTHTASTSIGNRGVNASIFSINRGIVSGIAPRAQIIAYRVCGDEGCYQSDSIAAIEQAIVDDVDVINFSIGGGGAPYSDAVELAFLSAYENGVFVAASAGNDGPGAETVSHRGPWVTTVAASTSNRHFLSTLTLTASNGDTLNLVGATVTEGISTPTPVEIATDPTCNQPPGTYAGKIMVCSRVGARLQVGFDAAEASAVGMILRNVTAAQGEDELTDNHFLPSIHLGLSDGNALVAFMTSHSGVMATFTAGAPQTVTGDKMASFSSRGGPAQSLGVSKPDITAPGVQILAGTTPLPATLLGGRPGQLFQSIQGTSMSSPHIAGAAALLKDQHPNWTPGQIKSAMMTSAVFKTVVKEDGVTPANAFDTGSGRIDLTKAGSASLTFDESAARYVELEDELWNANYPSLYIPNMPGRITVERTIHNETNLPRTWVLSVTSPRDVRVDVPIVVTVAPNGYATFEITIDASTVALGGVRFAMLEFKQGNEVHHFPITIVRGQPVVKLNKSCAPANIAKGEQTTCSITMTNTSFQPAEVSLVDKLPDGLNLVPNSITNGTQDGNSVRFNGALFAAQPPQVGVAIDPLASPAGYVPLTLFGITPITGVTDESIVNFNVPAFTYAGETYTRIGVVSNGYVVVGGGTGADVNYLNTALPNAALPNNVLAPFWTDLDPGTAGALRIGILSAGPDRWIVVEWDKVRNYSVATQLNTFQVWIGLGTVQDISFVYGPNITTGDGSFLTVGAENRFGNNGGTVYVNVNGTPQGRPPSPSNTSGYEVKVTSVPGTAGETRVITFKAKGDKKGKWTNCAEMTSTLYQGVNISCFSGEVTR